MDLERQALQSYVRVFAWLMLVAAWLPFDYYGSEPLWPWQGMMDAGPADGLALAVLLLGSGLFFWLSRSGWSKLALSATVMGSLALGWAVSFWAGLAPHSLGVFEHLTDGLPALFGRSFWLLLLGGVFLAAGLRLGARGFLDPHVGRPALVDPWPVARVLISCGIGLTVLFYLLPYRGSVPLYDLASGIAELVAHLHGVQDMALLAGHVLSVGPLLFALAAVVRLVRRPPAHGGSLAGFATAFLAGLCLLVGLRNLPLMPANTLIHLRSAVVILVVTAGGGIGLAALVRSFLQEQRWPWWARFHWLSLGGLLLVGLFVTVSLVAAHRTDPGKPWLLGPDDERLQRLFTEQLPALVLDVSHPGGRYRDRAAYKDMRRSLEELRASYPGIREGVEELIALGSLGRSRLHRVRRARDRLNRLLQRARVPYYVRSRVTPRGEGRADLFYLLIYRIRACLRYRPRDESRVYAVLHLERADPLGVVETYMGMTEEEETFVTVFLDRLEFFMSGRLSQVVGRQDRIGEIARGALLDLDGRPGEPDGLEQGIGGPFGRELIEALTRHELHHRWMGLNPEPPTVLWAALSGYSEGSVRGVTSEVGAYLGEMRYRPAYARLKLALMLDGLERRAGRRGSHGRARAFLVREILGVEVADESGLLPWGMEHAVERLSQLGDDELVGRIDRVHEELFGGPAPVFIVVDKPDHRWDAAGD